jgi:hypothetical protein
MHIHTQQRRRYTHAYTHNEGYIHMHTHTQQRLTNIHSIC